MQATAKTRKFNPGQITRAAVALAIVAGGLAVAATDIINDGASIGSGRPAASSGAIAVRNRVDDFRFIEMNLELPTGRPRPAPAPDFRFLEMNLHLPGSSSAATPGATPHWKVIEENSWGENFMFESPATDALPPSADDVPQLRAGQVKY